MKQVLQHLRDGTMEVAEAPAPSLGSGHLLIRTARSLVSPGTERMLLDFGKGSLIGKARQQPDKARMVLDKVRTDGLSCRRSKPCATSSISPWRLAIAMRGG